MWINFWKSEIKWIEVFFKGKINKKLGSNVKIIKNKKWIKWAVYVTIVYDMSACVWAVLRGRSMCNRNWKLVLLRIMFVKETPWLAVTDQNIRIAIHLL